MPPRSFFIVLVVFLALINYGQAIAPCDAEHRVGDCPAHENRWFYSAYGNQCLKFRRVNPMVLLRVIRNCLGEGNNFPTKEVCEAACKH